MNNKISSTVKKFNMLSFGDSVVVGVSGGADSMLLLNYLISVRDEYNLKLIVAHVEHGIRGDDSVADANFVSDFCKVNKLEFHLLSINAEKEAKQCKIGVEEYSRNKRYEFFNSFNADKIATAHNLSDNVETVLFRLCRGTGLNGVRSVLPVRGNIIRPLIELSSDEIRNYCDNNNIKYRNDITNFTDDYTRNYIRHNVIPLLSNVNSSAQEHINNFAFDSSQDVEYINTVAKYAYKSALIDKKLNVSSLKQLHISILKRVIILYCDSFGVNLDRLHLNNLLELLNNCGKVQIKGDLFAVCDNKYFRIVDFSNVNKTYSVVSKILNISEFDSKSVDFYCDYDKIIGSINIRSRLPKDEIRPAGRGCRKTLKKLFNELHVPLELRKRNIVVSDDSGVIGIIGYCVDERVKPDENTVNILSLRLSSED